MPVMLVYSFLEDVPAFPQQILNPMAYKLETFDTREQALQKARYVVSHSRVHQLAVWELSQALDDAAVRRWIGDHPASDLSPASEAGAPHSTAKP
jgi:hypothetical protein